MKLLYCVQTKASYEMDIFVYVAIIETIGIETITILVCKQISCNLFKNKVTDKLFTLKL